MQVRLVPMTRKELEMEKESILEIQKGFFEEHLKKQAQPFGFKSAINATKGDLFLFQLESQIIASAILEKIERFPEEDADGYRGNYHFNPETIRIFKPISADEFKTYCKDFKGFNRSPQYIDVTSFLELTERINNTSGEEIDYNEVRIKTKNDWIKVLDNEELLHNDKVIEILKFIYMEKDHITNGGVIAKNLNIDIAGVNSVIAAFGKRVLELLSLPEIKGENGQNRRWNIPFKTDIKRNKEGVFTWKLRSELVEAIEEKYDWKDEYTTKYYGKPLKRYERYTREDIHDIFDPNTKFTPGAGKWGGTGIVSVPNTTSDYVFLVTYGNRQSGYVFEENISEKGVLEWQSQPRQKLKDKQIQDFINHDHNTANIYLFLRKDKNNPYYSYLGKLAYISHDNERECPVHFKWQILDWDGDKGNISLNEEIENKEVSKKVKEENINIDDVDIEDFSCDNIDTDKSYIKMKRKGSSTKEFNNKNINFEGEAKKNSKLGNKGEDFVVELEKDHLWEIGRKDLAKQVMATREFAGNAERFDVLSFEDDGTKKYIEVKTTTGSINNAFFISENEVEFSKDERFRDHYYLYRLYEFDVKTKTTKIAKIKGPIDENVLEPVNYKCTIGNKEV